MGNLLSDIRFALRSFLKSPGFTLAALVTLALGIGANSAIFSVVNSVLLEPLPFPRSHELFMVWENHEAKGGPREEWTGAAGFVDWRRENRSFSGMAAFTGWAPELAGFDQPESLIGARVAADYFGVLGVQPVVGRGFRAEEESAGKERVAVLAHGLWSRRFGSDPTLVGRTISLNGLPHTVIGVLPAEFRAPIIGDAEVFAPFVFDPVPDDRGNYFLQVIGRLKPGVSRQAAQADFDRLGAALAAAYPIDLKDVGLLLTPLLDRVVGPVKTPLLVLLGAVAMVLLIACANVANLFLTRATARRRELAVRSALGANRGRLVGQLLTESLLLALAGGALGMLLGSWGLDVLRVLAPAGSPRIEELAIDRTVLGFTFAVSVATGLLFGLAPALSASRPRLAAAMGEGSRGSSSGGNRLRGSLVVAELALGLALLASAGLLLRTLGSLSRVDPGFDPERLATGTLYFPQARFAQAAEAGALLDEVTARLLARPDVEAVGAVSVLPLSGSQIDVSFGIEGRMPAPGEELPTDFRAASPSYFDAAGIPLLSGRLFDSGDHAAAQKVALVSRAFADRYFAGEDPVGRRMRIGNVQNPEAPWWTIVGVVGSVRDNRLDRAPDPEVYQPLAQRPSRGMTLVVRAKTDPAPLLAALRDTVSAADPRQPVANLATMEELVSRSLAPTRFVVFLLLAFAGLALVLAAVGVYGVMAYATAQRAREIGIRMALGARGADVLNLVLRRGLTLVAIGLALGLVASLGLGRGLASLLYGVEPGDPATLATVSALLAAVGLAACYLPARRAARVDPVETLKSE